MDAGKELDPIVGGEVWKNIHVARHRRLVSRSGFEAFHSLRGQLRGDTKYREEGRKFRGSPDRRESQGVLQTVGGETRTWQSWTIRGTVHVLNIKGGDHGGGPPGRSAGRRVNMNCYAKAIGVGLHQLLRTEADN